ncbi:lysophospholipase [Xylariaceae sp. FL0804]|nr:lysophospholipase [Xylariaceae sp. FL0804]
MHLPLPLLSLLATALASPGSAPADAAVLARDLLRRAAPDSPSGDYAPATVDCPSTKPAIRSADSLSPSETDWLQTRRANTLDPMKAFFNLANISGFDAAGYVEDHASNLSAVPNIAIAVSGGGYRALMNGAGFLAAADSRTPGATDAGGIGNLLQASTYLAGLSGGGWLVGSMYGNNFSSVVQMRDGYSGSSLWQFGNSIFEGPASSGLSILNTASYWDDVQDQVGDKSDAGFELSITDYWGRGLSYQLVNAQDGGPAYTFSSIAGDANFTAGAVPMPILVADERPPGTQIVDANSTVYEINPWEMGSWDPTVYGFAPTEYLGSNFSNGSVPSGGHCVRGFDQLGFIMGTSSSLFNEFFVQNISSSGIPDFITEAVNAVVRDIGSAASDVDIAVWEPNPFYGWDVTGDNGNAGERQLSLADGGEDLQNLPLDPLLQPARGVDVVFAVDSSADDAQNWPNATALRATYDRSLQPIANGTRFPQVPDANTFINLGLNERPTFFGCNVSEFDGAAAVPPLIVYIPNAPYTAWSNVSTYDDSYSNEQRNQIIQNGLNVATMGNGSVDATWPACAACAALQRSLLRTATDVPAACQDCFDRYCWSGATNSTTPAAYDPHLILGADADNSTSGAAGSGLGGRGGAHGGLLWAWGAAGLAGAVLAL